MTFYIRPSRGCMRLSMIEHLAWHRLIFLEDVSRYSHSVPDMTDLVQQQGTVAHSDCLIEGTPKDITSHFLLRMACVQDKDMEEFFVHSETELFRYRFSCMTHKELMATLKPLRQFLHHVNNPDLLSKEYKAILRIVSNITKTFTWNILVSKFVHSESSSFIRLPFVYILDLVRRRAITMDRGIAAVPCSKLCDVMTIVFKLFLERGMTLARKMLPSVLTSDNRIARLFDAIQIYFHRNHDAYGGHYKRGRDSVRCEDVDTLVDYFPPCMIHLHRQLRLKHRLDHRARIQYTLFLKEVGLPIHEALQFWAGEYSQMPPHSIGDHHSCQHNWKTDRKRYTYSIRHLYGLEGARINYRGHCCHSIQNQQLSGSGDGGCPFRHFDKQHLIRRLSLSELPLDAVRDLMKLSTEEASYGMACHVYLMARLRRALSPLTDITRCGAVLTANSNYVDGDIKVRTNIPGGVNPAADVNEDDAYLFNRISKTSHCDSNCHGSHSGKRFIAQHHSQVGTRKKKKLTHIQLNHPINQTQTVSKHTMDTLNLTQRQHPVSSVVIKGGDSEILVNNFKNL
ncbi:hypothetical protein LSH36_1455g00006 [Paralvinella palmiformis]|uniref:DNA primase large subunit C-terminal domain-containing protein n=1 Tax=Paralvinella palmiformis TaxID=53620 RepID=A0AAD9MQ96_9ANNE|nr:hypothetical protein LSH36_1455g00006 [Paralvinella palmiformis]